MKRLILISSLILLCQPAWSAYKVYVRAGGSSSADGTSDRPYSSLRDAYNKVVSERPTDHIEFHIHPGTYYGQTLIWDLPIISGQLITFRPWEGTSGRPRFIGNRPSTFFSLASRRSTGIATNIRFWHLRIENYLNGINFTGSTNNQQNYNSHNQVKDCWFIRIGNKHTETSNPGYKAIGLNNSRNNVIQYNRFTSIENEGELSMQALIHAIYISHFGSENTISFNYFANVSGDPVKVRDQSNGNIIRGNIFYNSGRSTAALGDWYCNAQRVSNCRRMSIWDARQRWECPSWDNDFRYNMVGSRIYDRSYRDSMFKAVRREDNPDYSNLPGNRPSYECPTNSGRRFRSASNRTVYWSEVSSTLNTWGSSSGVIGRWRSRNGIQ